MASINIHGVSKVITEDHSLCPDSDTHVRTIRIKARDHVFEITLFSDDKELLKIINKNAD